MQENTSETAGGFPGNPFPAGRRPSTPMSPAEVVDEWNRLLCMRVGTLIGRSMAAKAERAIGNSRAPGSRDYALRYRSLLLREARIFLDEAEIAGLAEALEGVRIPASEEKEEPDP